MVESLSKSTLILRHQNPITAVRQRKCLQLIIDFYHEPALEWSIGHVKDIHAMIDRVLIRRNFSLT